MRTRKPIINLIVLDQRWKDIDLDCLFEEIVKILNEDFSEKEVSVVLTNDAEVQKLNKTYRNRDKPTNVLSFPSTEKNELGDILLSYETVMQEAKDAGISPAHHIYHLIVHGFLHLLGYDHENEEEAQSMETTEIRILNKLNIKNPYEDQ